MAADDPRGSRGRRDVHLSRRREPRHGRPARPAAPPPAPRSASTGSRCPASTSSPRLLYVGDRAGQRPADGRSRRRTPPTCASTSSRAGRRRRASRRICASINLLDREYDEAAGYPAAGHARRRRTRREVLECRASRRSTRARGDDGTTALGGGQRVPKDSLRIEAYGTVDELNSHHRRRRSPRASIRRVAEAAARDPERALPPGLGPLHPRGGQGADAGSADRGAPRRRAREADGPRSPRSSRRSRTSSSRAARRAPRSSTSRAPSAGARSAFSSRSAARSRSAPHTVRYLNRLSDALFVMARHENQRRGVPDVLWNSRA